MTKLPTELSENLRSLNPWWEGLPGKELPTFKRWPFVRLKRLLARGMTPATILRGPRRVGKTILLRQLIEALLAEGVPAQTILYVPFDELPTLRGLKEPVLDITRWYEGEVLRSTFNQAARKGSVAYLFLDEGQNLDAWAPQVKNLVDNHSVRVLVTGSSSLRIEAGRDSLAGRITNLDVGPLFLREIAYMRQHSNSVPLWPDNGLEHLVRREFLEEAVRHGRSTRDRLSVAFGA